MKPRLTREEFQDRLRGIILSLRQHIGKKILLISASGRRKTPIIAKLADAHGKIYAKYMDYAADGSPRGERSLYVNPLLVYSGELDIVYFDDGV